VPLSATEACSFRGIRADAPTGAENVLQWLNSNGFTVPDEIAPVLEDYIRNP
jgi:hypothetical protein